MGDAQFNDSTGLTERFNTVDHTSLSEKLDIIDFDTNDLNWVNSG